MESSSGWSWLGRPVIPELDPGGLQVQDQPELHSDSLSPCLKQYNETNQHFALLFYTTTVRLQQLQFLF